MKILHTFCKVWRMEKTQNVKSKTQHSFTFTSIRNNQILKFSMHTQPPRRHTLEKQKEFLHHYSWSVCAEVRNCVNNPTIHSTHKKLYAFN